MQDNRMQSSLAEEFQRRMDLSEKSMASSLELSKDFASSKNAAGILVQDGADADPYQFLEDDSSREEIDSDRQLSTSDLMQTEAEAIADPYTLGGKKQEQHYAYQFTAGASSYLHTSDGSD